MFLDGGGGGGCFLPFCKTAFKVDELADLDGTLPYDVAGDAGLSPYDLSGLLFLKKDESSDGSSNTSLPGVIRLTERSWDR